jgi:hypothetical protein
MNKYIYLIISLLFITTNTFSYFKGKDTGIEQQSKIDQLMQEEQENIHKNNIEKIKNLNKKIIYDKKRDYNFTGNLDDDQLLQALEQ